MATGRILGATSVALRSLLVGGGLVLLLVLVSGPDNVQGVRGPVLLALWIAAIVGGFTMAWTRAGRRRWVWAGIATFLLLVLTVLMAVPISIETS